MTKKSCQLRSVFWSHLQSLSFSLLALPIGKPSAMASSERAIERLAIIHSQLTDADKTVSLAESGAPIVNGELQYSVPVPEHLTATGDWQVRRGALNPAKLLSRFPPPLDHITTLYDILETTVTAQPEAPYLGTRTSSADGQPGPYEWMTYAQAAEARTAIGSGLLYYGLQKGAKVGLYSVNCQDWVLVDAACHAYSITSVPLYDTLGPDAVGFICGHAELSAVACSAESLGSLLEALSDRSNVKLVVVYGWSSQQVLPPVPSGCSAQMVTLAELQRVGRKHSQPHHPPSPQDLALLCYTSGTTGTPKGAMLSHQNLISFAISHQYVPNLRLTSDDVHCSYLPLAHIYERGTLTSCTVAGSRIGFYRGDIMLLLDDVQELRPTVFFSVPRLYNRIYDRVMGAIRGGNPLSRKLFEKAYAYKKAALLRGDLSGGHLGPFWDKLVFSKVKARLGGKVRVMVSGASPIGAEVMDFLRICFSATVIEGYGLTESSSCCSATLPEEVEAGHVGGPIPSVEIKLEDILEMKYTNADLPYPRGEICLRGYTVFRGYYKDEKSTKEAIDQDGWFHTGDVAQWLPGGRLQIIDRKKAMFKLAQGEYIAAEKVENVHIRSPLVAQSFVYGDSLRSKLVAIVVPDPETLLPWAAARDLPQDLKQLCDSQTVKAAIFRSILEEGRTAQLRGFEQVAAIQLHPEAFSVANGLQTPTFKLKRAQAKEFFQEIIVQLYDTLSDN